jgi:hypothetical protein
MNGGRMALGVGAGAAAVFEIGWTVVAVRARPRKPVGPPAERWPSPPDVDPFDLR